MAETCLSMTTTPKQDVWWCPEQCPSIQIVNTPNGTKVILYQGRTCREVEFVRKHATRSVIKTLTLAEFEEVATFINNKLTFN